MKIGIIDTGINPNLSEFAGRIDPASGDVYGERGASDEDGHGTAVSAVAAAARDGSNTHGVAFEAIIVSLRADKPGTCSSKDGCAFYDDAIAQGIDAARIAGAKVINLSLGGSTPSALLLAAMQRAVDAGIVLVIAAGNDGTANPDPFALTPAEQFPGMVIIAGSIGDSDGDGGTDLNVLSSFSNKAGQGAVYYLTALGYRDRAPDHTGQQYLWSGTSFSAPTISGAVALLAHAFPNLTGAEIVEILFISADDLGAAGIDSIFGNGRLNLGRAFQPIGTTTLADGQTPVSTTDNGDLPPAAGDANQGSSFGAIILDGYDRAFVLNLARTLRQAELDRPLARSIRGGVSTNTVSAGPVTVSMTVVERRDLASGFTVEQTGVGPEVARRSRLIAAAAIARLDDRTAAAFGFSEGAKSMERRLSGMDSDAFLIAREAAAELGFKTRQNTSVALRRTFGSLGVTMSAESGAVWSQVRTRASDSPYRWAGVMLDREFAGVKLSAGLSRLDERQTLLGGRMSDVLGAGGSTTTFFDVEARKQLGRGFAAQLTARRGWTDFVGGKVETEAYGLGVWKERLLTSNDRLALRLAQPLRVASGGFAMMLPTGYDYRSETATSSWSTYSLTPSGREITAELSYGSSLWSDSGWIGGNMFLRRHPGHVADAQNDYGGAIRVTLGF